LDQTSERANLLPFPEETPMQKPLVIGIVLATCAFATPHVSDAAAISMHPFACNLIQNASPWGGVSGATYSNSTFTNSSGVLRRAVCPIPFQNSFNNFRVSGTSGVVSCILKTMSEGGGAQIWFGTRSVNTWTFDTTVDAQYAAEVECELANGSGLYWLVNY
jgi:hypothetical protein